jgi:MFS transporter, FSR family, fosmidomycin resistance protein
MCVVRHCRATQKEQRMTPPGADAAHVAPTVAPETTVIPIIAAVAFCHLLNDLMQSLIPAIYPLLKDNLTLSFSQIGTITLVFQGTASVLQPLIGLYTDKRPLPYALAAGMGCTLAGLLLLAHSQTFGMVLLAVALIGLGSSIFHPESSRIARLAAGKRPGFAQSFFQVGGNFGSALGPLAAAAIVLPRGQASLEWFGVVALVGIVVLIMVGRWFIAEGLTRAKASRRRASVHSLPVGRVRIAMVVLVALTFSKFVYMASFSSYYTFYLIERFGVGVGTAQIYLFVFLAAVAAGTLIGGPIGDRIGRKQVIWLSILGVLPVSAALPHVGLEGTIMLSALAGLILASAFPAIVVYAQELLPQKVGMVAGLFFGLAFGMGAVGAAVMGRIADATSITYVFQLCAWLPAIGIAAAFLPSLKPAGSAR